MFCLLVCFEIATVIRGIIAVIADIFWWVDLMSVITVFAHVVLCVASELALVTLKISFLRVSRHMPPQHDFPKSTARFLVALVAHHKATRPTPCTSAKCRPIAYGFSVLYVHIVQMISPAWCTLLCIISLNSSFWEFPLVWNSQSEQANFREGWPSFGCLTLLCAAMLLVLMQV